MTNKAIVIAALMVVIAGAGAAGIYFGGKQTRDTALKQVEQVAVQKSLPAPKSVSPLTEGIFGKTKSNATITEILAQLIPNVPEITSITGEVRNTQRLSLAFRRPEEVGSNVTATRMTQPFVVEGAKATIRVEFAFSETPEGWELVGFVVDRQEKPLTALASAATSG